MMGGRASKRKGSVAELEIAAKLQAWWRTHNEKAIFKRVPLSGGWGDAAARGAFRSAGDVMTDDSEFPLSVEVKRREGYSMQTFMMGRPSPVWGYWRQAVQQSVEMNSIPMLVFRRSHEPWSVLIPSTAAFCLLPDAIDVVFDKTLLKPSVDYSGVLPCLVTFEAFLRLTTPRAWLHFARSGQHG